MLVTNANQFESSLHDQHHAIELTALYSDCLACYNVELY